MRIASYAFVALLVVVLGCLQTAAAIALRANAASVSLAHVAPDVAVRAIASLEPGAFEPQELRRVLGTAALASGDVALAKRFAHTLSTGPDRLDLLARIEAANGEGARSLADFLAAGDLASIEARVDALVAQRDLGAALRLQSQAIEALRATHAQNDTLAEAFYRDGLVEQARAYEFPVGAPARTALQNASSGSYRLATVYAPLELRYAIALGNQYLNAAQYPLARAAFERVRAIDPSSVEALTGLADDAIRERDFPAARAFLERARNLSPDSPDIARMSARIPAQ